MPYQNVPAELTGKMDDCVQKVMARGMEKERAIAICYASIVGKEQKEMDKSTALKSEPDKGIASRVWDAILDTISTTFKVGARQKEESLDEQRNKIQMAFGAQFSRGNNMPAVAYSESPWAIEMYSDHVIAAYGDKFFKVKFTQSDSGIMFVPIDEWIKVERTQEWIEKAARLKVGARHNTKDNEMVQGIHDNAVALGATCKVIKQTDGSYRWVLISSSAYQDRDGEIVSQKALEADVIRADADKDYGPLLWWHESSIVLGDCDFNAMHGPFLVESGTFRNKAVGAMMKEHEDELGGSLAFYHPLAEPDKEGVFSQIRRFERSNLPKEVASNLFTFELITNKERIMDKKKLDAFKAIVGDDLAAQVIQAADAQEKQADAAGVRRKEDQAAVDTPSAVTAPAAPAAPVAQTTTPEALAQVIAQAIATALAPIQVEMTGLKAALGEQAQIKAVTEAERQKAVDTQAAKVTALEAQLTEAQKSLKELTGDLPRGVARGYRASQDEMTITKDERLKASQPQADPISEFVNSFVMPTK